MRHIGKDVLRIMDANLNRAVEGVRVLEESARMVFNDSALTSELKDIRHTLVNTVSGDKNLGRKMLFARDSEGDVLREGTTESEASRDDMVSIVRANAGRAQEAVRNLEEFVKLSMPEISGKLKNIRFRLYDCEKSLVQRMHLSERLDKSRLALQVLLYDMDTEKYDIGDVIHKLADEGVGGIAWSSSQSTDSETMKHSERLIEACSDVAMTTLMCGRMDIALMAGFDGIMLQSGDVTVKYCRRIAGMETVICSAVSNYFDAQQAVIENAQYVVADFSTLKSPAFGENTELLTEITSGMNVPVLALCCQGGDDARDAFACGVSGILIPLRGSEFEEIGDYKKIVEEHLKE